MDLEDFTEALESIDADYYFSGNSIRLRECPECTQKNRDVIMDVSETENVKVYLGKCVSGSCGQGYSSMSYLVKMGMDEADARSFHGFNPHANFKKAFSREDVVKNKFFGPETEKVSGFVDKDISRFMTLDQWPDHPVADYINGRGYRDSFCHDSVLMDTDNSAVVFVARDRHGEFLGFQRRFIKPLGDEPKTKTSMGFKAHDHIIVFNPGKTKIAICEGPFTAITAAIWGYTGVATFGADVSQNQLNKVLEIYNTGGYDSIHVAEDNDEAGKKFYNKIKGFFSDHCIQPDILKTKVGNDINDAWVVSQSNPGMKGLVEIQEGRDVNLLTPVFKF